MSVPAAAAPIVLDRLPDHLLEAAPAELARRLGGPTLIHLAGRRDPPLFVSVLLHGDEGTGWRAVQRVLASQRARGTELPRSLSLFVGNVAAAEHGLRRLPGQPDYNRIWPGAPDAGTPEHAMAARVVETMRRRGVFASIDIHNNTGTNPIYGCITRLDVPSLHLAALFGRTTVHFGTPQGVQTLAFATLCPSITVECGKPETEPGVTQAAAYVEACLHLDHFPEHPVASGDIDLFRTVAVVKVPPDVAFGYGEPGPALVLPADVDRLNFRELAPGEPLALAGPQARLAVTDDAGRDVFERWFEWRDGRLLVRRPVMPSMLTLDARAVRQDCLCYLMERVALP